MMQKKKFEYKNMIAKVFREEIRSIISNVWGHTKSKCGFCFPSIPASLAARALEYVHKSNQEAVESDIEFLYTSTDECGICVVGDSVYWYNYRGWGNSPDKLALSEIKTIRLDEGMVASDLIINDRKIRLQHRGWDDTKDVDLPILVRVLQSLSLHFSAKKRDSNGNFIVNKPIADVMVENTCCAVASISPSEIIPIISLILGNKKDENIFLSPNIPNDKIQGALKYIHKFRSDINSEDLLLLFDYDTRCSQGIVLTPTELFWDSGGGYTGHLKLLELKSVEADLGFIMSDIVLYDSKEQIIRFDRLNTNCDVDDILEVFAKIINEVAQYVKSKGLS